MSNSASITPELLDALLSPDAGRRQQAEAAYQSLTVVDRVQGLMAHVNVANSPDPRLQLLTAVLLRRDILKLADANLLPLLVQPLLSAFSSSNSSCRLQVGHCLAEVCASLSLLGEENSTVINQVLPNVLASLEPSLKQGDAASFKLLGILADRAPVAFTQFAVASLPSLMPLSTTSPQLMEAWTQVVVNAAIATTILQVSLVRATPNLDEVVVQENSSAANLGPALAPIWTWMTTNYQQYPEDAIQESLQHLAHAAVTCPSLLAGNPQVLESLVQTCLELSKNTTTSVKLAALQVLASLASVGDVKRRHLSSNMASAIATTTLPICAQIMAESLDDDVEEWASEPATLVQDGMDDDHDDAMFAESLAESFLQHLGALSVALPLVQQLLESQDSWKHARAGLALLECALAAAPISLAPHLQTVVQAAASLASSSTNARIQYQAIRLLGAMCETHASIREPYSQIILERLAGALASPYTKVSAMASLGIVSYCRGDGDEDAGDYLQPFLNDLLGALVQGPLSLNGTDTGSVTARVRAMGATACIAEACGEAFGAFYPIIMPGLMASAQLPVVELAGAAVEAATIVGQAVGKDLFGADAQQLLTWILPALQTETPILEQLLSACARVASVLEEDFAPHLDAVLPHLLRRAQEPPDVSVVEGDEGGLDSAENDDGIESMTVAVPGRGFTKVQINTSKIQEKAQATRAVYELAKAGASFGPYAEGCLMVFLPLINFQYSSDIRSTAAQTSAAVFEAACAYGEQAGMQMAQKYMPLLTDAIAKQIMQEDTADMEALYALVDSLSEVYYIVHRNSHARNIMANYTLKNAQQTIECCMKAMAACLERRSNTTRVLSGALTGEDEKEEYLALLRAEEQLLTPLVDSVGYTIKLFRQDMLALFEQFVSPVLAPHLASNTDVRASVSAVCLFDDAVEHCGTEAAAKYSPLLLQGVVKAFETTEKDLIQAAVYGVIQMARHAPSAVMSGHIQTIIHRLISLTSCSKEDAGDDVYLVEIATSALASLTLFGPYNDLKFVSRDQLLNTFLSHLPIQQDNDEGKICHAALCTLIESGAIDVGAQAAQITRIIGTILQDVQDGEEIATPDTVERLTNVLYQLQQNVPASALQQAFAGLDPEAQNTVSAVIADFARSRAKVITP